MMALESKHLFIAAVAVVLSAAGLAKAQTTARKPIPEEMLDGGWKPWTVVIDAKTGEVVSTWRQPSK